MTHATIMRLKGIGKCTRCAIRDALEGRDRCLKCTKDAAAKAKSRDERQGKAPGPKRLNKKQRARLNVRGKGPLARPMTRRERAAAGLPERTPFNRVELTRSAPARTEKAPISTPPKDRSKIGQPLPISSKVDVPVRPLSNVLSW